MGRGIDLKKPVRVAKELLKCLYFFELNGVYDEDDDNIITMIRELNILDGERVFIKYKTIKEWLLDSYNSSQYFESITSMEFYDLILEAYTKDWFIDILR